MCAKHTGKVGMRLLSDLRGGADRIARRSVRHGAVVAVVAAMAACSGASPTAPTTSENVALMDHFDSALAALGPDTIGPRETQLIDVITLLSLGAPVQTVRIGINGTTQSYSGIGGYEVTDNNIEEPWDSAYKMIAWRGSGADTVLTLAIFDGISTFEITDGVSLTVIGGSLGSVRPQAPHGSCTSFAGQRPPDVAVPPGLRCNLQTVTVSATGMGSLGVPLRGMDTLSVPSQSIRGIRVEGPAGR